MHFRGKMESVNLKQINENILELRKELKEIKLFIKEDFELSDWAKNELKKARLENKSVSHKDILRKYTS